MGAKKISIILFLFSFIFLKGIVFSAQSKTIGVLPFDNLTQDKDLDWLKGAINI